MSLHDELSANIDSLRALLSENVGYELPREFKSFIVRQAVRFCRENQLSSGKALLKMLRARPTSSPEWTRFISRMTIGESYFFRNHNHIETLKTVILPVLMERARKQQPVAIWSAGCARGEEPYTCLLYTSPSPRDLSTSRMPSSA